MKNPIFIFNLCFIFVLYELFKNSIDLKLILTETEDLYRVQELKPYFS